MGVNAAFSRLLRRRRTLKYNNRLKEEQDRKKTESKDATQTAAIQRTQK